MIPEGMHDVLPLEAAALQGIEEELRARFVAYGYGEVRTPVLEFASTLAATGDDTLVAGYRVFDAQGQELMLRTDLTTPVARLTATRCEDDPLPLRLFYVGAACRPWAPQRSEDGEFVQAGAELIGLRSAAADAECVTLLCDVLAALGVGGARVVIGTMAFVGALVDSFGLLADDRGALWEALADRDYPLLESILGNAGAGEEARVALQRMLQLSGTRDSLAQARKLASNEAMDAAVDHVVTVRDLVAEAGYEETVVFDLGLSLDLDYYTGLVVEAYAPGVGLPLATGGRYDDLLARYGWDVPAVGFALSLDRLHQARREAGAATEAVRPLWFIGGLDDPARAAQLRRAGLAVASLPDDGEPPGPPWLRRQGSAYAAQLADGRTVAGGWHDVLEALTPA